MPDQIKSLSVVWFDTGYADYVTDYTLLSDRPSLYDELTAAGYAVDASQYAAPDAVDLERWHAQYIANGGC